MSKNANHVPMKIGLIVILRLLIVFGLGLLLGVLGDQWDWNRLENPWPFLALLCPLLLGISVALLCWGRAWLSVVGAVLAWFGFYLTFVWIAFHLRPYQVINPPQPDPSQSDALCSPCFSSDLFTGFFILCFFPVGLLFVMFIAFATSDLVEFVHRRRNRPRSC